MKKQISILFTLILVSLMIIGPSLHNASADIIPPKKQTDLGIAADDVTCESGMFKVFRERTNTVSCVKINHVIKLIASGWAKPVEQKSLDTQIQKDSITLGTITKLYAEPVKTPSGNISKNTAISGYDLAFEICASSLKIYVPEVLIKSDSETQRYEIPDNVSSNTCILSATFIKATDPNSIKITLLNKGDISKLLSDQEASIASLQNELEIAKKTFSETLSPDTSQSSKIADLRKQINDVKEDYYRLYFTLYATPTQKYNIQKLSFTGTSIEGESAKIITVKKAINTEGQYDVVFEACAGKNQIALPVAIISSDKEATNVKIGNKISPNTCQMTSAKISSINPETITIKTVGDAETSKIPDLENQLNELQKEITDERETLRSIIHNPNKAPDFKEQVEKHTAKIIELRGQIGSLKADYNKILYQAYRQ